MCGTVSDETASVFCAPTKGQFDVDEKLDLSSFDSQNINQYIWKNGCHLLIFCSDLALSLKW